MASTPGRTPAQAASRQGAPALLDQQWFPPLLVVVLWVGTLAWRGSVLDLSASDYVERSSLLPDLITDESAGTAYRNWSILPLILGRLLGADTTFQFALVQWLALVVGTALVVWHLARTRGSGPALAAVAGLFATTAAAHTSYFAASYDQLLVALLCAAVVVRRPLPAVVVGIALGLTHAEVALVVALALVGWSWAGRGRDLAARLWLLLGIVTARIVLTIWFAAAGVDADRRSFVSEYGIDRTWEHLTDTWPIVLWTALCGGWVVVAVVSAAATRRERLVIAGWIATALVLVCFTVDQTRISALLLLPLTLSLVLDHEAAEERPVRLAALVGLAVPLVVSIAGTNHVFSSPFEINW